MPNIWKVLVGYMEGYREAYIWTFQDENIQISAGNLKTTYIYAGWDSWQL